MKLCVARFLVVYCILLSCGCTEETDDHDRLERAKALVAAGEAEAAIPALRSLLEAKPTEETEYLLARALLECGEAEESWELFEPLLTTTSVRTTTALPELPVLAARALTRLDRAVEARSLLLPHLTAQPGDRAALHVLAVTLRSLGAEPVVSTAAALTRRSRELLLPDWAEERAARSSYAAWRALERARSQANRDRLGDVLSQVGGFLAELEPGATDPRTFRLLLVLEADALIKLAGVPDAAEILNERIRQSRLPILDLARARLFLRSGALADARRILETTARARLTGAEKDILRAHRARVLTEIGAGLEEVVGFVESPFDSTPPGEEDPEVVEIANFCRAELLLAEGKPEEACRLVGQSVFSLAGGRQWAGAIRLVASPQASADPSDLIDYPHLLVRAGRHSVFSFNPEFRGLVERVQTILEERPAILFAIVDAPAPSSRTESWLRLLELYRSGGALRKAREVGWYLAASHPHDREVSTALARALARPEELFERLAVTEAALRVHGDDTGLARLRGDCLRKLGVAP